MAQCYYLVVGQEVGPVELSDLRRLAAEGRLTPHDQVRRADSTEWHQAQQLKGLFAATQGQPTQSNDSSKTTFATAIAETKDARSAKPPLKKSNHVMFIALGCLAVPVVALVLLVVLGLIVGPNPQLRERAGISGQSKSTRMTPAGHENLAFVGATEDAENKTAKSIQQNLESSPASSLTVNQFRLKIIGRDFVPRLFREWERC